MKPIEERLLKKDDFEVFLASDGYKGIRLMSETKRREEASAEIKKLKKKLQHYKCATEICIWHVKILTCGKINLYQ